MIIVGLEPNETWPIEVDADSDENNDNDDMPRKAPYTSEIEDLLVSIQESNTRLLKLCLVVQTPFPQKRLVPDTAEQGDIQLVKHRFEHAQRESPWLLEKLAMTMTKCRKYLDSQLRNDELYGRVSTGKPVLHNTQDWDSFEMVAMPKLGLATDTGADKTVDRSLKCPYCRDHIAINDQKAWETHVSEDLKPYICTFEDCTWRTFSDSDDWFSHELQNHRREWVCPEQCQVGPFSTMFEFNIHLLLVHNTDTSQPNQKGALLQSEEPMDRFGEGACLLCTDWDEMLKEKDYDTTSAGKQRFASAEIFKNHLASHMKELVAWTVPEGSEEYEIDAPNVRNQLRDPQPHRFVASISLDKDESQIPLARTNSTDDDVLTLDGKRYAALVEGAQVDHTARSSTNIQPPNIRSSRLNIPMFSPAYYQKRDSANPTRGAGGLSSYLDDDRSGPIRVPRRHGLSSKTTSTSSHAPLPSVVHIQDFEPGSLRRRNPVAHGSGARGGSTHLSQRFRSIGDASTDSDWTYRTKSTWTSIGSEYGEDRSVANHDLLPSDDDEEVSILGSILKFNAERTLSRRRPGTQFEGWAEGEERLESADTSLDQVLESSHPKGLGVAVEQPEDIVAEHNSDSQVSAGS
jgi:hypothetical protein